MKNIIKSSFKIAIAVLVFSGVAALPACNDNPDEYKSTDGVPTISYVRIPDALSGDSLIEHAFMNKTIALVGSNLRSVREIWFNDQKATLNTSFITDNSLIVVVPNNIPEKVTNMMYLLNSEGDTIKYPFKVDVPSPLLSSMQCEYVEDGDTAVIHGNYLLATSEAGKPEVIFTPNIKASQIVSYNIHEIKVIVPTGSKEGPITVKSRYGTTRSTAFHFRDTRGMILDWDNLNASGGWRSGVIASDNGIAGKYVKFSGALDDSKGAGSTWNEDGFSFNLWGGANGRPEGDLFTYNPATSSIKFEINIIGAWTSCALQMIFTPWSTSGTNGYIADGKTPRGIWNPWAETGSFTSNGWITVTVPLSQFKYTQTGTALQAATQSGSFGGLTFFVYNGGIIGTAACTPEMHIDNIRVVPNE